MFFFYYIPGFLSLDQTVEKFMHKTFHSIMNSFYGDLIYFVDYLAWIKQWKNHPNEANKTFKTLFKDSTQ